jgi:hypothetical protein
MAQYVAPEVHEWLADSQPTSERKLALVFEADAEDAVRERAAEYNISIDRCLPSGVLLVTATAADCDEFIETSMIESVSTADRMTVQ